MNRRHLVAALAALLGTAAPAAGQARSAGPDPILVQSTRMDALVEARSARDVATDPRRFSALVASCRGKLSVSAADSTALVASPLPELPAAPAGVPVAIITVLAKEGAAINCGALDVQRGVLAVRGVRLTADTYYTPDRDVTRVVVHRGDAEVRPLATVRTLVKRLGRNGFSDGVHGVVTIAIDLRQLDPGADGIRNDITIDAFTANGTAPDRFILPWTTVQAAWEAVLPNLVASLRDGTAPMALPTPRDPELLRAHEAYARDDLRSAISFSARRLGAPGLSRFDKLHGRMHLGLALAASGDTVSARVVIGTGLSAEPCFTLASTAPASVSALLSGMRQEQAQCKSGSLLRVAARAAVMPGFGRPVPAARKKKVLMGSAGLALVAVGAYYLTSQAHSSYDDYLAYQARPFSEGDGPDATAMYEKAESARTTGNLAWGVAGAVWSAQLAVALVEEYRVGGQSRGVRNYGAARSGRVGLVPAVGPREAGVALSISW